LTSERLSGDDPLIGEEIVRLTRPNTRVIYLESAGSPTFEVQDVPAIAAAAHEVGAKVLMDNTWTSPTCSDPSTDSLTADPASKTTASSPAAASRLSSHRGRWSRNGDPSPSRIRQAGQIPHSCDGSIMFEG
jgi:hypothetical protein